jgi:hypothetical protein
MNCGDLTSVEISNSVTNIGDYAFSGSGITSIDIPTSVTEIGRGAFSGCTALTELTIPNSVTILGAELCRGCTSLTSAKIPGSAIHSYKDNYINGIDLVDFDGSYSFWYCPLTTLEVGWDTPPNVYENYGLGMWVDMFSGDLRFYFGGNLLMDEVTNFNYANCTLIVPPGTVELYRAAGVWNNFETIIDRGDLSLNVSSIEFPATNPVGRTVSITTNYNWTATKNPAGASWFTITPGSGAATANSFTVAAVGNNPNVGGNEAEIIVANGYCSDTIKVAQLGNTAVLDIAPATPLSFDYDEITTAHRIDVTAFATWTVAHDPWIIINPAPSGYGPGYFTISVTINTGAEERKGKVTVTNTTTLEKKTIDVTQNTTPYLRLPPADTLYFGANESTQDVIVTSNADWTVGSNVSWVTLSANVGRGNGNFYATAKPNTGGERKGIITLKCSGKTYIIHVEQKASPTLQFKTGNIYYYSPNRNGTTVEVTAPTDGGKYSGNITIPAIATDPETGKSYNVIRIGEGAFYYCATVTSVTIPYSVLEIGERAFAYCDGLASVRISNSVERIGGWAFNNCINLASVEIPRSVKKIMNGAFDGCSKLTSISIPNTVNEIASMAFHECSKLTIMHVYWDTPPQTPNIDTEFSDYTHCTLYVPYGKRRDYQYAWYWANFVDIIERSTTGADEVTAESAVTVRASSGRLYIDSPSDETIYVYSFTGKLLHTATKTSGRAVFDLPAEKLLIVRGNSGWARKLMVNY